MTPLQALDEIKKVLAKNISEKTGISEEKHFEYLQYDTEIDIVAKALTELEELKRDVKRYFELVEKTMSYVILGREDECDEVERLKDKLLKVGKAE